MMHAQVLPVFLRTLPPREDFTEVAAVVRCLLFLLSQVGGHADVRAVGARGSAFGADTTGMAQVAAAYAPMIRVFAAVLGPPMEQVRGQGGAHTCTVLV
jgi:hypothetical protein